MNKVDNIVVSDSLLVDLHFELVVHHQFEDSPVYVLVYYQEPPSDRHRLLSSLADLFCQLPQLFF